MRALLLVGLVTLIPSQTLLGQEGAWRFDAQSASPIAIPPWLSADSLRYALEYERIDQISGLRADLNADGVTDYVFQYSTSVCGTNCQYAIVDGRSRRRIALLGGTVVVIQNLFINRYPVINTYGHSSADAGYWSTLVFDGEAYVSLGSVYVQGGSLERVFGGIEHVPYRSPERPP